jgi:hypothetical protein
MRERAEMAFANWLTRGRCMRLAIAVVATTLLAALHSYATGAPMVDANDTIIGADFSAFYVGGRLLHERRADELYDFKAQKAAHDALIAPVHTPDFHPYINPPFFAAALSPLSALPYRTALALWWMASGAALLATVVALRRDFAVLAQRSVPDLLCMALLFYPTLMSFLFGQNSVFTLLLLTLWLVLLRRGRELLAGVALGFLLFKPQLALGPVLIMLTQTRFRVLVGALLGASAWLTLGAISVPGAMHRYSQLAPQLFQLIGSREYPAWGLESLFGFGVLLLVDVDLSWGRALGYTLTGVGAACIVLGWLRVRWEPGTRAWDLRMAATIAMSLVTSPHLYHYDAMLLLLPLALLFANARSNRVQSGNDRPLDGGPLLVYSATLYAALVFGPLLTHWVWDFGERTSTRGVVPQLGTCAIVLWAFVVMRTSSASRARV